MLGGTLEETFGEGREQGLGNAAPSGLERQEGDDRKTVRDLA
jgi:hypothetical protein